MFLLSGNLFYLIKYSFRRLVSPFFLINLFLISFLPYLLAFGLISRYLVSWFKLTSRDLLILKLKYKKINRSLSLLVDLIYN